MPHSYQPPASSDVTITDQFCGAGGSSIGATRAGANVRLALNHWKLAIQTHNTNFPNTDHDCTDVSAANPRRYRRTDGLITSPECTNHSLAKGVSKKAAYYERDLFGNYVADPSAERSRATMWDVPRFAEYHHYNFIVVENVVDARSWVMWDAWLMAMRALDYEHRVVYYNSMFAWPTPQSRDRMYVVFWKRGNRAPDLDIYPAAWCAACEAQVGGVQTWKRADRQYGRYGKHGQYVYTCPSCGPRVEVSPFYYPALTAIDWSLPIERIGDRKKPLKERTMKRIELGLERFRGHYMIVDQSYIGGNGSYTHSVEEPWTTQTARQSKALVGMPLLVPLTRNDQANSVSGHFRTQTSTEDMALAVPAPFLVEEHGTSDVRPIDGPLGAVLAGGNHHYVAMPFLTAMRTTSTPRGVDEVLHTVVTDNQHHLVTPPPFIASYYGSLTMRGVDEPLGTVTGKDHHAIVQQVPFIVHQSSGEGAHLVRSVQGPFPTMTTIAQHRLAIPMPFISSQYNGEGRNAVRAVTDTAPCVPGMAVHYIAQPGGYEGHEPDIEDCGFRMLQPPEIGRAQAFPEDYVVLGTKREKVKQYGNAVTPPMMELLIRRCVESLA